MAAFAADPDYRCPRQILVVIGGDPTREHAVEVVVLEARDVLRLELNAPTKLG